MMKQLLISKKDFFVKSVNFDSIPAILSEAREKECVIVRYSFNGKLSMNITDPVIETGDHFNIGIVLEEGREPIFYRYSASERVNIFDISKDENCWILGSVALLMIIEKVEDRVGYVPKIRDWIISKLSSD